MEKTVVIIPAYNPAEHFNKLVDSLKNDFSLLVINDGSDYRCAPCFDHARKAGATVLVHEQNKGKGAALKTAIQYLKDKGGDWIAVTADADGQHLPKDIKAVAELAQKSPEAMVLGVRNFKGMPFRSRFGNTITRGCFHLATKMKISDTQTGLRGFSHLAADRLLTAEGNRYEYEMNVLLNLKAWKMPCIETVIETVYLDNNSASHFHPVRDSLVVFGQVIKHTLVSLGCTLLDYVLYLILIHFTDIAPEYAYLLARVVSSVTNYQLARRVVFPGKPDWRTAAAYFMLALCVVSLGSMSVMICTNLGFNESLIKFPVDTALFFINFFVQKYVIFR